MLILRKLAVKLLADKLENEGIKSEVKGRSKHLFSTYRKILAYEKENKTIDEINFSTSRYL